jgi:hypothetical protein
MFAQGLTRSSPIRAKSLQTSLTVSSGPKINSVISLASQVAAATRINPKTPRTVFLSTENLHEALVASRDLDTRENRQARPKTHLCHCRRRRPRSARGRANNNNVAVKSERVIAPTTTRSADGTVVSGMTIGEEIESIAPTDQTV